MFRGFANVWTPVVLARVLGRVPLGVTLAGERVVLFRDTQGRAHGLLDQCPHRGVQLSLGKVTPEGCLQCPFHAWEFAPGGAVHHIPLNPDAKRDHLSATPVPVRELGNLIWVFTAPGAEAPDEPTLAPTLTDPSLLTTYLAVEWNAHWTRVMENMLDSPHVPYLHRKTIGRFVRPYITPTSRMDVSWEETTYGGRTVGRLAEAPADRDPGVLDFYRPNVMVLTIPIPNKVFRMHAISVPISDTRTRLIIVGARNFAALRLLNPFFNHMNRRIADEDQAVVESSLPVETPEAGAERSVRTDRATLQFRRYYFEHLKDSSAPPPTRVAVKELPVRASAP